MIDLLMGLFGKVKALRDSKLDSVVAGTNIAVNNTDELNPIITNTYAHPTGDGSSHVPATGTGNDGKVLTARTTAGEPTWETPSSQKYDSFYFNY